jgi:hypothetical protein
MKEYEMVQGCVNKNPVCDIIPNTDDEGFTFSVKRNATKN